MKIRVLPKYTDVDYKMNLKEYTNGWWFNPNCPVSFSYFNIHDIYPKRYFDSGAHPDSNKASNLYNYMQECFNSLFLKS